MKSSEIRQKFLDFFAARGHTVVPSSSLIPDDPSVLLTTAGMQQFKKYYTGEADPMKDFDSKNTVSIQKSFRTSDVDEVGDETHLTFFEMLGNFSFGGYGKREAITYAYEFITKELGLQISYVTVFEGKEDIGVPKDEESRAIWKELDPSLDVREEGIKDVFWGPTGNAGPCGPTTEIYCKNAQGKDVEIWNIVFNEFFFPGSRDELLNSQVGGQKQLEKLQTPGVDTGMGFERLAMIAQQVLTIFDTDLFREPFGELFTSVSDARVGRILADHIRAAVFLLADGVRPSNKERGYILRRLIRRALLHATRLSISLDEIIGHYIATVVKAYGDVYLELVVNQGVIIDEFRLEAQKFLRTLDKGLREFDRRYPQRETKLLDAVAIGKDAFDLYQSFGFPPEVIREVLQTRGYAFNEAEFQEKLDEEFKKHQELSRAGAEKKFGGHGLILDTGELKAANEEELKIVTRLHTATHMLQQALRTVLGPEVHQAGSDITVERTRFDFTFPRKLTPHEIKKVEDLVNKKIIEDLPMQKVTLPKAEAEKTGALYFFKEKYPDPVNVYFVGRTIEDAFSKEFCGGPHVTHTGEIGKFKIAKEEAVAAGVRRIRGVVS